MIQTAELDFQLPEALVPKRAWTERGQCRLMVLNRARHRIEHTYFYKLCELVELAGIVETWANDTKVPALSVGDRGQSLYARADGSAVVASGGIDLTPRMIERLAVKFLTLHIGTESMVEIKSETIEGHGRQAKEVYYLPEVPGVRVLAVGTSTVKALESWGKTGALTGESDLFIREPFRFAVTGALLTRFHHPRSTALALVAAFTGLSFTMGAYELALKERYRFSTFGDCMLIL